MNQHYDLCLLAQAISARLLIGENMNNINSGTSDKVGPIRLFQLGQLVATPGALDALEEGSGRVKSVH